MITAGADPRVRPRVACACLAAVLTASSGCLVLTLQPAYEQDSVVFNESLVGTWTNVDDQTQVTIERGEWRSYRIVYTERSTSRTLNGNLTQIGTTEFLDVTEMRGVDPGPFVVPVHGVFRVRVEGDMLTATPLDFEWFMRAVGAKRPGMLALAIDDRRNVTITSPSADLRRWLARAPAQAFGTPMTFSRQP